MYRALKTLSYIFLIVLLSQFSCEKNITNSGEIKLPELGPLTSLGFEDKFALRMEIEEPYLYVCAGSQGLWRKNLIEMTEWVYLGLADTTLGMYSNVGVLDFDITQQDILVAYNGSAPHINPENTVGIWRSTDGGQNWFSSDSGIPETITDPYEYNIMTGIQRSPHQPAIVISVLESIIYRSSDAGKYWELIAGRRGVIVNMGHVRWHPYRSGEVLFFGETGLFAPYLGIAENYGLQGKTGVDFDALGFPNDGFVSDVAFDSSNPDVIYAATSEGLIKTPDGGYNWQKPEINIPGGGFIFRMIEDPLRANTIYLAGGRHLYFTPDGAKNIIDISEFERGFIQSLVFDSSRHQLIIGTTEGIYTLPIKY